jgi:hypothetical protein
VVGSTGKNGQIPKTYWQISGGIGGIKILNRKEGEKRAGNTSNRSFKLHPLSLNTWRCLILHINSNLTWPNYTCWVQKIWPWYCMKMSPLPSGAPEKTTFRFPRSEGSVLLHSQTNRVRRTQDILMHRSLVLVSLEKKGIQTHTLRMAGLALCTSFISEALKWCFSVAYHEFVFAFCWVSCLSLSWWIFESLSSRVFLKKFVGTLHIDLGSLHYVKNINLR